MEHNHIRNAGDANLGQKIAQLLKEAGIETPMIDAPVDPEIIRASFTDIMVEGMGLDLNDDSLRGTPARIAKMYGHEIFYGLDYANFPAATTVDNKMKYDEVVVSKGADVLSVCEHHFVPFVGKAHIGYIPKTKVLGLSKINRVVDFFSRRPQVQERLTAQIHLALTHILETDDVSVVIECQHFCVRLRGVEQDGTSTVTSKMSGKFMGVPALRTEFMALIGGK